MDGQTSQSNSALNPVSPEEFTHGDRTGSIQPQTERRMLEDDTQVSCETSARAENGQLVSSEKDLLRETNVQETLDVLDSR